MKAIELKDINPVGVHLWRYMTDPSVRLIICYGGSSSGKSYSVAQIILILTAIEKQNTLVMRKVGASISKTIYEDFKASARQLGISDMFKFQDSIKRIRHLESNARIDFAGLDDPEKIKGISSYKRVVQDEWSEFDLADFKQLRKRLRGRKGQQIITTFNPINETHWIKRDVIDMEEWHEVSMKIPGIKEDLTRVKSIRMNSPKPLLNPRTGEIEVHAADTVIIQSTYLNNFWVVGSPDGTYGYYDEQCIADFEKDRENDPDYYNVYALGEWGVIRTGAEFFSTFSRGKHCADIDYDPSLPIHLSVDNNRLPYISYTFWQADYSDGIKLRQFHEICAESPDNSAVKSAKLVVDYLRSIGYGEKLYLHGDASTRSGNTIDDEGRSFLDKVISTLTEQGVEVVDKVGTANPSVSMTGEFINAILEGLLPGLSITISNSCKVSIDDYQSVQKDQNGAILKTKVKNKITGQTYEEHGHISDTFRYVCHDLMNSHYITFANRRKRNLYARDGAINFYNPSTDCKYSAELVYCMPNVGGKFVMVYGGKCGSNWHIRDIAFVETSSTDDVKARLNAIACSPTYVETAKSYFPFVRELRSDAGYSVKVVTEDTDIDRRIAATSDYVRSVVLFNEAAIADNVEYAAFMDSLFDYNKDSKDKAASAVLSGFIKTALKLFQDI